MRTTLDIDDDVLRIARRVSAATQRPIGKVISDLAARGLAARGTLEEKDGIPVFSVAESAPTFGPDQVHAALDEADDLPR
ncbi:MAG: antitoxin [Spirochaetaceae bacterium]|nr:MAG: antitoxin [Spirochaetaceae bacterium]